MTQRTEVTRLRRQASGSPPLFLINLDSAGERRRFMTSQLHARGLEFRRIGIDMRTRPPSDVARWARRYFPQVTFDFERLSCAEVGCWLSHLSAWRCLIEEHSAMCCIVIEDDLILGNDFSSAVAALEVYTTHDVVYLGTSSKNLSTRRRTRIEHFWAHEPVGAVYNTWGYSITRNYVWRLFASGPKRLNVPIDHFLGGAASGLKPRVAVMQPTVIAEEPRLGKQSQIGPHTLRVDRWPFVQQLRRGLLSSPLSTLYYRLYQWL